MTTVCPGCGAPLQPDAAWCGRCLAPVARPPEPSDRPPMWLETQRRERVTFEHAVYSRWRPGPTSFGALGRAVMTVLVLFGAIVGYPLTRGALVAFVGVDAPGKPFLVGYAIVAAAVSLYLLLQIWKRARVA
jgi:hypothetical protein